MGLIDQLLLINQGNKCDFQVDENGVMRFRDRVCAPDVPKLRRVFLRRLHKWIEYSSWCYDLKRLFWWPGIKDDVVEFVYSYLTFQKSKIEHQKPLGLMQLLNILEWKCNIISMDFVRLHGVPSSIVPDRDLRLTSRFWENCKLHLGLS